MERVYLDSNVLYPISVADLLLRLGDVALHHIVWSEDLLIEVQRVLVAEKGLTRAPDEYLSEVMGEHAEVVMGVIDDMGAQRREPQSVVATMAALDRAGLKQFVELAKALQP